MHIPILVVGCGGDLRDNQKRLVGTAVPRNPEITAAVPFLSDGMYVKLFSSLLDSSLWSESPHIKTVWITMLLMADQKGFVDSTIPGLARRAGVPQDQTEMAIEKFLGPDEHSRSPDQDGARITAMPGGGWRLINYERYRAMRNVDDRREYMRDYMRDYRKQDVNPRKPPLAYAEAEAEADVKKKKKKSSAQSQRSAEHWARSIFWCKEDGWTGITQKDRQDWSVAYPACNVDLQLESMQQWLLANPRKAHKSLWRKFLTGWLSRAQDKGGDIPSVRPLLPGDKGDFFKSFEKSKREREAREKEFEDSGSKSIAQQMREEKS